MYSVLCRSSGATCLFVVAVLCTSTPARADSPESPDSGESPAVELYSGAELPSDHPSVAATIASQPDRDLVICIAGCGPGAKIVHAGPGRGRETSRERAEAAGAR
jgi:hypothetical protein